MPTNLSFHRFYNDPEGTFFSYSGLSRTLNNEIPSMKILNEAEMILEPLSRILEIQSPDQMDINMDIKISPPYQDAMSFCK